MRKLFPLVREAVAKVVQPSRIRWIGFSHFEADEYGSLIEWLSLAPQAEFICGTIAATVNINDFAHRQGRLLADNEVLTAGRCRFKRSTMMLPHHLAPAVIPSGNSACALLKSWLPGCVVQG